MRKHKFSAISFVLFFSLVNNGCGKQFFAIGQKIDNLQKQLEVNINEANQKFLKEYSQIYNNKLDGLKKSLQDDKNSYLSQQESINNFSNASSTYQQGSGDTTPKFSEFKPIYLKQDGNDIKEQLIGKWHFTGYGQEFDFNINEEQDEELNTEIFIDGNKYYSGKGKLFYNENEGIILKGNDHEETVIVKIQAVNQNDLKLIITEASSRMPAFIVGVPLDLNKNA